MRRKDPETSEAELTAQGKLKPYNGILASVLREEGKEVTVVAINWARFNNEEIITHFRKWVKANRPKNLHPPDGKGRNKARDWHVALERLGMLRLLHQFRLSEMPKACPKARDLYKKREWYKERKHAGEMFRKLFPFHSKSECPLSWPTKGGRSR